MSDTQYTDDDAVDGYPLSVQQLRYWESPRDHRRGGQVTVAIDGRCDPDRLRGALIQAVEQHEALRTRLVRPRHLSQPIQLIDDSAPTHLRVIDAVDDVAGPDTGLSATLSATGSGHTLRVQTPPGSADSASLAALGAEIAARYCGLPVGEAVQYTQFDAWQQAVAAEPDLTGSIEWTCTEDPPVLLDGLSAATGCRVVTVARLDDHRWQRWLSAHEADAEATLFALFSMFAGRRSGADHVVLGYTSDGRVFEELAGSVGLLSRVLPIGLPVTSTESVATIADRVRAKLDALRAWQQEHGWPQDSVQDRPDAEPTRFEYLRLPAAVSADGVTCTVTEVLPNTGDAGLALLAWQGTDFLEVELQVPQDTDDAVEALVTGLHAMFTALIAESPGSPDLPVLGEREWQKMLSWGRSHEDVPGAESLLDRFARHTRDRPQAVALSAGPDSLTYAELNERVRRVAAELRARGLHPEQPVAVCALRDIDSIVSMLGVLVAGGAFVALDPQQPDEVVQRVIHDLDVRITIWPGSEAGRIAALAGLSDDHGVSRCDHVKV